MMSSSLRAARPWFLSLCCLALLQTGFAAVPNTDDWALEKDSYGVKVYTRSVAGWDMKEYKAVVQVRATLAQVEAVLRDAPNRGKWIHNAYNTKDVKVVSKNEMYTYCAIDAPLPVSDRDNVVNWKYVQVSSKEIRIDVKAACMYDPNKAERCASIAWKVIGNWWTWATAMWKLRNKR